MRNPTKTVLYAYGLNVFVGGSMTQVTFRKATDVETGSIRQKTRSGSVPLWIAEKYQKSTNASTAGGTPAQNFLETSKYFEGRVYPVVNWKHKLSRGASLAYVAGWSPLIGKQKIHLARGMR